MGNTLAAIKEKSFYEILNLERDASVDQIKESYKEIAKLYHPDSNFYTEIIQDPLTHEETEVFKFITLAYTTLSNDTKRSEYDKTLAPLLKGWDENEREREEPPVQKPSPKKAPTQPQKSPGSIDLGRFHDTMKTRAESSQRAQAAQPQKKTDPRTTILLVGGAAITAGICAGLGIILFWG